MIGGTPMKVGTETRGNRIEHVLWENNEIVECSRPVAAELKDGAQVRKITWRNNRVRLCNRPFDLLIITRQGEADQKLFCKAGHLTIDGLYIDRYGVEGDWFECSIHGLDEAHSIRKVTLKNILLGDKPLSLDNPILKINDFVKGLHLCP
jgi:hypothetical protein